MLFYGNFGFHYFFLKIIDILFQQTLPWLDFDLTPFSPIMDTDKNSHYIS